MTAVIGHKLPIANGSYGVRMRCAGAVDSARRVGVGAEDHGRTSEGRACGSGREAMEARGDVPSLAVGIDPVCGESIGAMQTRLQASSTCKAQAGPMRGSNACRRGVGPSTFLVAQLIASSKQQEAQRIL